MDIINDIDFWLQFVFKVTAFSFNAQLKQENRYYVLKNSKIVLWAFRGHLEH